MRNNRSKSALYFRAIFGCLMLLGLFVTDAHADDWPFWRGPDRNDQSQETGLLQHWPQGGPKQLWVNQESGLGYSGFSIVDGKLFTMGLEDDESFALCLDANTGKELWRKQIGTKYENSWGDGPRGTPTVDGERVYFMTAQGHLACLQAEDGGEVWAVKMSDFDGEVPKWGYAESPLVDGDRIVCTPGGNTGTMLALDKKTGKKIWQSDPVNGDNRRPIQAHYSSIMPCELGGQKQYVQLTVSALFGVAADTGEILWQSSFPGRVAVIPSPIVDNNQVYVTAGYGIGSMLVKIDDDQNAEQVWFSKAMQNHHGGVIKIGDYFYGSSAKAFTCQNQKTGDRVWVEREIRKGAVAYADNRFYHVQEDDGKVLLFAADESGIKPHGQFVLSPQTERRSPKGRIWVHPVISGGKLYLRDQEIIYCYDIKS